MTKLFKSDTVLGLVLAVITLVVYVVTLSPSIGPEDAGEIAAAVHNLGVTHPTGYPLYSLLAKAFTLLPLGDLSIIARLNLLGALLVAAATFVLYQLIFLLLRGGVLPTLGSRITTDFQHQTLKVAAAGGALSLAFSRVIWANAVTLEVYALHLLFVGIVTILFLKAVRAAQPKSLAARHGGERLWQMFAYALGLSFSNHMMTLLLAPAFLWLYFTTHGVGRAALLKIARAAPLFALALSTYLYLPIRAALSPVMNWGDPSNLHNFWLHVSGQQYRDKMFSSLPLAIDKLGEFFIELPSDFGYLPVPLAIVGIVWLWRAPDRRPTLLFVSLLFLTSVVYAINYNFDDANFRINAHLAVAILVSFGLAAIGGAARAATQVRSVFAIRNVLVASSAFAVVLAPAVLNFNVVDERENYVNEDFARNVLESLDSGSILLSHNFNHVVAPARYLQYVEGLRPDVVVLESNSFLRPWVYNLLALHHPDLIVDSRPVINDFLAARAEYISRLGSSGRGPTADSLRIVVKARAVITSLILNNAGVRPVYLTPELGPEGFPAIYQGFAFRIYRGEAPRLATPKPMVIRPFPKNDDNTRKVRATYAHSLANTGLAYVHQGDTAAGIALLRQALVLQSHFPEVRQWLTILGARP